MAAECGVGETWMFHTGDCARLALASRPPDEDLVRPEALVDLPQMRSTLLETLDRAGLLAAAAHTVLHVAGVRQLPSAHGLDERAGTALRKLSRLGHGPLSPAVSSLQARSATS
ncbi:hypothetical protein OG288_42870 [Streptomyces tauricus]|uniref:Uncharacterized protein n=1 Tax=Streptomyces tauricus TaxID=68274 RepID=A0ABZ1JV08_9ACTN|nr:hypothetical protein [Streptomyces tauricus]